MRRTMKATTSHSSSLSNLEAVAIVETKKLGDATFAVLTTHQPVPLIPKTRPRVTSHIHYQTPYPQHPIMLFA